MNPSLTLGLPFLLLASVINAQNYDPPPRPPGAFSWIQPLNTTIIGPYGHSPEVKPSPRSTGAGGWEVAYTKAQEFVAQLTLDEKSDMVTGQPGPCVGNILPIPRLGFSGLCIQDGPLSVRLADYVSTFAAGVTIAASWDPAMMFERGHALGKEFRDKGSHVALGPVCGPLGRSAFSGRGWEGFSPDPYLSGIAMEQTIMGMQSAGVQATAKHFIGNEQETQRNPTYNSNGTVTDIHQEAVSSNIDDRTMHELYLWPFYNAVRAKVASVMCAYNRVNGSYACENSKSLNGLLKQELGFQGYVMSDWGGVHSGIPSIKGGLDMNMPGGLGAFGLVRLGDSFFGRNVTKAVNNATLHISRLDDMIVRIMTPYFFLGQDTDYPSVDPSSTDLNDFSPKSTWLFNWTLTGESSRDVRRDHAGLIRKHGSAGTVLLKNVDKALPLKSPKSIAVFGNDIGEMTGGYFNADTYEYGTLPVGGGSGTGRLSYLVTPLEAIKSRAAKDNALVQQWQNNSLIAESNVASLWVAKPPEVCLVFLKTYAKEGVDRFHLDTDWNGTDAVESVASACNNTMIVTHSPGINLLPFADHPNITAILAAHYPGPEIGNSIVDILYGDVNPSGKLPYTITYEGNDYNAPPTTGINTTGRYDWQSWFTEELEIDYRYFDAKNISVRYEFGYGLSYTTFEVEGIHTELLVNPSSVTSAPPIRPIQPGGNPALWDALVSVTVSLSNTGDVRGAAVPQLYVSYPDSTPVGTPPRQLRGFDKVTLEGGETRDVFIQLMRRDISYWDVVSQEWVIPSGDFELSVGFSSRDLRQFARITLIAE